MPAQVIVQLIADPTGLEPGIDSLEKLGAVDEETASQFKATTKAFQERTKVTQATTGSTDKLAAASKKLVESIAGGAINQAAQNIERIGQSMAEANQETLVLNKTLDAARQKLSELSKDSPDFDTLSAEIEAAELALSNLSKEAASSRGKLRQYRETLLQLEDAGLEGTQVFQDLAVAAGELEDAVGDTQARIKALASDTFELDATIEVAQGVAGAFGVAAGAAGLFGDESEDTQKALLKLNQVMAVFQGLQQIQNLLQAESTAAIAANIVLQRIQTVQTQLQAAAESKNILVKYASIIAQRALNAVVAASPTGILLLTISALASALLILTSNTDKDKEAQERLNKEMESQNEVLDLNNDLIEQNTSLRVAQAKSAGALASTLSTIERDALRQRAQLLVDQINLNKKRLENEKSTSNAFFTINQQIAKDQAELDKLNAEGRIKNIDIQQMLDDEALRNAKGYANARIAQTKKDSIAEAEASIAGIQARRDAELAAENLTAGEKAEIIAQSERDIAQIRQEIQQKSLQDRIAIIKAEGLETKNTYIKLEKDIQAVVLQSQLDTIGKNANQVRLIEAQRNEDIRKLREDFFKQLERIDTLGYIRLIDRQAAYGKQAIREQVLNSAQIAQARLLARQDESQRSLAETQRIIAEEKALRERLKETALTVASSLAGSLNEIAKNQSDYQLSVLQKEQDKRLEYLQKQLDQGAITQEQYNASQLKIQQEYDRKTRAIKIRAAQQEKQLALFQAGIAQSLAILSVLKDQTIPFVAKPLFIGLAIAQAVAQIAAIASKPIPAFKKGTKNAPGGLSLIGEAGPELFFTGKTLGYAIGPTVLDLPKGSKVIPSLETERIMNKYDIPLPTLSKNMAVSSGGNIDYKRLAQYVGREVGSEIAKMPLTIFGYDKHGPFEHVTTLQNRRNFLNKRFGRNK